MGSDVGAYMPLWIGDYLADTGRLTTLQHGCYLLLLMDYWRNGSIPDSDAILMNITRTSESEWNVNKEAVIGKFQRIGGKLIHKRVERELEAAKDLKLNKEARAKAGANARWGNASNMHKHDSSNAKMMLKHNSSNAQKCPSPSPSPNTFVSYRGESDRSASPLDLGNTAKRLREVLGKPKNSGDVSFMLSVGRLVDERRIAEALVQSALVGCDKAKVPIAMFREAMQRTCSAAGADFETMLKEISGTETHEPD